MTSFIVSLQIKVIFSSSIINYGFFVNVRVSRGAITAADERVIDRPDQDRIKRISQRGD